MSEQTSIEFPQIYKHENGGTVVARDETQASAFEKQGFKAEGKFVEKKEK